MKPTECVPVERLVEAADGVADDPERRHLERCPRCLARLALAREFLRGRPGPAESHPEAARRELTAWLEREVIAAPARPAAPGRAHLPWRSAWPGHAWAPALAAAALIVVTVWLAGRPTTPERGEPRLRGGTSAPGDPRARFAVEVRLAGDGQGVELRWPAVPGAGSYRVSVLRTDLSEIARFEAGAETRCALPAEAVRRLAAETGASEVRPLIQVTALRFGDPIARSRFVRLP